MSWQDILFTGGNIVFIIALLPTVFDKQKPAVSTSAVTASVLIAFTIAYASLGFWSSAAMAGALSLLWFILLIQRLRKKK